MNFTFYKDETEEVVRLINEVFNTSGTVENFKLQSNQRALLLKNDNKVIGVTLITLKCDPIKNTKTFYLDYICIDKEYRERGLGEQMLNEIERIALESGIDYLELTSNKTRVTARNLYKKIGMSIKDTDLFIKNVKG